MKSRLVASPYAFLIAHLIIHCNSMVLINFPFFQCKTAFNLNTCHVISNISRLLPSDHLSCSNLTIVFYPLGNIGRALCIRLCHEDLILTIKSHNCSGIVFILGDSAGDSKLIEQTILQPKVLPSQVEQSPVSTELIKSMQRFIWKQISLTGFVSVHEYQ